jgi:hypothetical protein
MIKLLKNFFDYIDKKLDDNFQRQIEKLVLFAKTPADVERIIRDYEKSQSRSRGFL